LEQDIQFSTFTFMASSVRKTKNNKASSRKASASLVPAQRKKEVAGLILMVLAILVSLALVTYTPLDSGIAVAFNLRSILDPGNNHAVNALGILGAAIANLLVPHFLGYTVLILPAIVFAWGYVFFRNKTLLYLPLLSVLVTICAFFISSLLGWFSIFLATDLTDWSGTWGFGVAGWMQQIFGSIGSLVLILLALTISALLLIDKDIQRSVDRVGDGIQSIASGIASTWSSIQERRLERHTQRSDLLAERVNFREKAQPAKNASSQDPTPKRREGIRGTISSIQERPSNVESRLSSKPDSQSLPSRSETGPKRSGSEGQPQKELELRVLERIEEEKTDVLDQVGGVENADIRFEMPPLDLLDDDVGGDIKIDYAELEENKQILLDKLSMYNIEIIGINAIVGPTVTLYELTPAPGVKISRITSLVDDLAMAMAAPGIRMIAPIPGKSAIGVEIPNRHRELVRIRDLIGTAKFRDSEYELPLIIGKTIEGEVFIQDLTKMPHILIAGATGSGKSVGLNAFIAGLLYASPPSHLKFVLIDPKKIELQPYARFKDHYVAMPQHSNDPIITDFMQALGILKCCEKEMEQRYDLLSKARVRGVVEYNKRFNQGKLLSSDGHKHLPYIVVVVDELADLMMTDGKDIEGPIARLAQMARAVGIHLILATQRPSVDVITGLIKANFPARIAYKVATKTDSRTILDQNGAEGLVGNGDLLFMLGSRMLRLQGPFVSIREVDAVTQFIGAQPGSGPFMLPLIEEADEVGTVSISGSTGKDELFAEAARIIVRS